MKKLLLFIAMVFSLATVSSIVRADSGTGTKFSVTKTATPSTVSPLSTVSFTISIKNITTQNTSPLQVKDTLPQGFVFSNDAKLTKLDGTQVAFVPTATGQTLTWTFDGTSLQTIPPQQNVVISFSAKAPSATGSYTNQACLTNPENVCATANVVVQTNPNTGLLENTLGIVGISSVALVTSKYLRRDKRSFEQKIISRF